MEGENKLSRGHIFHVYKLKEKAFEEFYKQSIRNWLTKYFNQ
ncbi:hypothetical protein [Staphylococcus simiae]|uniref:Uncharacterized protein n=1 Tax=Staphylococcus simiae CCM 7213 = CCUG 51256 TaxID=911238 RepID=G5JJV0_9STAP|nr:hypothetical protein [Staphylococcus simiae]EHJ07505.1 hypothetical protein SS7213T_08797 [Staphylococcus simiae CCM 7213 = CCUG 51256]SNV75521.1 Uncharacterised protein [Staphylococcus simiae]